MYLATIKLSSYGGMELLRPESSNSGGGLASPRSDTSYDVITTGSATPFYEGTDASHNGISPAPSLLCSEANTIEVATCTYIYTSVWKCMCMCLAH